MNSDTIKLHMEIVDWLCEHGHNFKQSTAILRYMILTDKSLPESYYFLVCEEEKND